MKDLNLTRIKSLPDCYEFDNARYLLYRCSSGYPIGIFSIYESSPIKIMDEEEPSQLFFAVSFLIFTAKKLRKIGLKNRMWKLVHDRVTENVLNRLKQLYKWRIESMENNNY